MFWHSFHLDRAAIVASRPCGHDDPIGRSGPPMSHMAVAVEP
jgi:hypothetical protein